MYKIIITFQSKFVGDITTLVFTYSDIKYCREQIQMGRKYKENNK